MIAEKVIKAELLTAGHFLLSSAPVLHTNDSKRSLKMSTLPVWN